MIPTEIKERFENYQLTRNTYIAKTASKNTTMNVIPDPECEEILHIMCNIYDFAYRQAINDCMALSQIEFPNNTESI
jgi:hypothetical protein